MSSNGKAVLDFVKEIRKLSRQISDLLGTTDGLMAEKGWNVPHGKNPVWEASAYLPWPMYWFPNEVFRFYTNSRVPHLLAFVAVMLDDREGEYEKLEEPLLAAGWFDYGSGQSVEKNWEYWFARFHGYMENRKDDGTIHVVNPQKDWPKKYNEEYDYKFAAANTFAVPLMLITDTKALKSKITDPLVRELNKATK